MSRATLVLLSCSTLMGCILTRNPNFDPPANTPPVVVEDPDYPMNRFIDVCLDCAGEADGGLSTQVHFLANVRDPDVDQHLEGRVFLDYNQNATTNLPVTNEVVPTPTTDPTLRRVEFDIDKAQLRPGGCRVVELHVSQSFIHVTNPVPADQEDFGRGVWFLRVLETPDDDRALRGCEP